MRVLDMQAKCFKFGIVELDGMRMETEDEETADNNAVELQRNVTTTMRLTMMEQGEVEMDKQKREE